MNNRLIKIQDMLYNQMKRLDNDETMKDSNKEIQRSGALSQSAGAYIKSVQTQLKIKEMCKKNPAAEQTTLIELGIINVDDNLEFINE